MKQFLLLAFTLIILKSQSQSITVNYPNGGDTMYHCNTDTIRFTATGTSTFYNIEYSVNGGTTWQSVVTNIKITNGKYAWTIPINITQSVSSLIRITDKLAPTIKDTSDGVFNILKPIAITSPNGGEVLNGLTTKTITWSMYNKSTSNYFNISYSVNGGSTYTNIVSNYQTTSGSYDWLIPSIPASTNCLIKVQDATTSCKVDVSDAVFTINPPLPIIIDANGGKTYRAGNYCFITWDPASIISSKVRLEYTVDSGKIWKFIDSTPKSQGLPYGFNWMIPNENSTKCFIKIVNNSNRSVYKISDTAFTLLPAVTIYTPFKADTFYTCNQTIINFDKSNDYDYYAIEYQEKGSGFWNPIDYKNFSGSNTSVAYTWTLPQNVSYGLDDDYIIRIYPQAEPTYISYSDTFHVKTSLYITNPRFDGDFKPGDTLKLKWFAEGTNNSFDIGGIYKIGTKTYSDPKFIVSGYVTNTNTYDWIIPANIVSFRLSVRDNIDTCKSADMYASASVSAAAPNVKLVKGNGGDSLTGCSTYTITWTKGAVVDPSTWALSYVDPVYHTSANIATVTGNVRSYTWTVPDIKQNIAIVITAKSSLNLSLYSDYSDSFIYVKQIGFKAYPQDTIVCAGATVQLNASTGFTNYAWTPNSFYISDTSKRNPTAIAWYDQTYTVKAKLGNCVVTDNVVLKTISPTAYAAISISTDAATKCAGKAISFTSNTTNAGSNAIYQWFVNGVLKDSSHNATFTYNKFKNNDSIWCVLNSSLCVVYKSEKSNVIKISFVYTPIVTNDTLNSCGNVIYKGNVYTSSTVVKDTLKFIDGCDSMYHNMNVIIKNVTTTTKNTNIIGCNQVTYNGNVYNTSTILQDTVKSYLGCDSVYNVTNIIVNTPLAPKDTFATVCNSINWYGTVYTKDTIATHSSPNYITSVLNEGFSGITIADVPTGWTFSTNFSTYISVGNYGVASPSLRFAATNDQIITPSLPASATKLSFWLKNQGAISCSLKIEGFNGTNWVTVNTITSFPTSGTTIVYNAASTPALPSALTKFRFTYTKSSGNIALDDVSINYITGVGCDSTIALHLTIKKAITINSSLSGCIVKYKGITYTSSANIVDTIKSYLGCDSIYKNISITVLPIGTTTQNLNIFGCNSAVYNGNTYTVSIIKRDTVKTSNGCDSIYKVANITVKKITPTSQSLNFYGCGSLSYNNNNYYTSTVVKDTFKTTQGCDSFYMTANIIIQNIIPAIQNINLNSCDSVVYKSQVYKASANFIDTLKSIGNCDSVYNDVTITINYNFTGNIKHPTKGNINTVTAKLTGTNTNTLVASGSYTFNCLAGSANGTVRLSKNNDVKKNNGVSSIDVILVTNHILNKNKLNSPYKLIAADVNNNKTITNIDVIFMKRLILGIDTTFTGNKLWAFVDSSYAFPDTTNPFPYKDSINFNNLASNKTNQSFIGVKLGDVNYDWNATLARGSSIDNVQLIINNDKLRIENYELRIPVAVKNFKDLTALQYTLNFDNSKYEFVAIRNNKLEIEYNATQANATGNISFLWADSKGEEKRFEDGSEVFTLVLKPKELRIKNDELRFEEAINNLQLTINNSITEIEAWDKDNQQHNIVLTKQTSQQEPQTPNTKQWVVSPNPNDGNIIVSLFSNTNKTIVFELSSAVGKTLFYQNMEVIKGFNKLHLNLNEKSKLASGVYFIKAIGMDGENVKRIVVKD